MTTITGPLALVTTNPDTITEAWIRAPHTRGHGTGIITEYNDRIEITDGHATFTCAPGPAVLTLVKVVETGRPSMMSVSETQVTPMLVPEAETATLREVVEAARLSELGDKDELEAMAAAVASAAARAEAAAAEAVGALASKADLVGGVVPTSQIPAVALTKPQQVFDRAGMLALQDVQEGDVAVISTGVDKGTYMLTSGPSNVFSSWVKLTTPDAPVQSVNGQTGTVVLGPADIGATSVGSALLAASSQSAARSAIGAGTSSLTLGTTSTTAARGDHAHDELSGATGLVGAASYASRLVKTHSDGMIYLTSDPWQSYHPARKGYVDSRTPQIQVVVSLPSSPVSGTVYIVTG